MAMWEVLENARRKGRLAYIDGVPLCENPMRSALSRLYWEDAWKAEERKMLARDRIFQEPLRRHVRDDGPLAPPGR